MKRLLLIILVFLITAMLMTSCTVVDDGANDKDINNNQTQPYRYTAFTAGEKAKLTSVFGEVIPFIPNNEYYFEDIYDDFSLCYVCFYTYGNTASEFDEYLSLFVDYDLIGSETDSKGITWYYYEKGDICVDIAYYVTDYAPMVDVFVSFDSNGAGNGDDPENGDDTSAEKVYNDFTASEREGFVALVGEEIPFLSNNEYHLEFLTDDDGDYIFFYTYGNTRAEFEAYLKSLDGYVLFDTETDDEGITWYYYDKGNICLDIAYHEADETSVIYVYVYLAFDSESGGNLGGNEPPSGDAKIYNEFTSSEKKAIIAVIGESIPFLPNNEYCVESLTDGGERYVNFRTYGNTRAEFEAYLESLDGYVFFDTETDDEGITWYYYDKGNICLDIAYYETDDGYVVDIYAYRISGGDSDSGSDSGNGGAYPDGYDVITNDGAGLPTDPDGVYDVDFTIATNVKDVTDQGYYLDGCPTVGAPTVLVIPVEFADVTASSKGYDLSILRSAFKSNDPADGFYSVYEYYNISSYGQLTVDFTVLDEWFRPSRNSSYYARSTDYEGYLNGDQIIINEALAYLDTIMDLSKFDSDGNGIIDAIVIVNTLDIDENSDFYWAYRYWNYYTDFRGHYYEYDGVSANDYLWASFDFLFETYDEGGNPDYTDRSVMNTYTFIHEFGHILGADDYYDLSYGNDDSPLMGMDVMDSMLGDHNAYTKFNYGWITTSRLVVCEESVTLTLEAFAKNGDTIIITNNWDDTLGAYQEYYVIVYYTAEGLNSGENAGYFLRDGVVVYHVNASLYRELYGGTILYDVYNNNTDPSYDSGTVNNLIEYVKSASDTYTYVAGDTMGETADDSGNPLAYNFVVDSIDGDTATITFTRG